MPNINRDFDFSEQVRTMNATINTSVGASAASSFNVCQVPYPCRLQGVAIAAGSLSGTPVVSVDIKRFTAAGVTTIASVGSTLTVLAFGLSSAYQMIPLVTAGSTLRELQAGDLIVLNQNFSGGNVAIGSATVTACIQALQDIKTFFNITP